jgi:nucleotide-binding universal stress UspA family protein
VRAYDYAQSLAGHYRATLIVEHIVELSRYDSGFYAPSEQLFEDFRRTLISNAENDLHRLIKTSGGLRTECIVQEGIPSDAIISLARERAASLIVLGTHGRRGFDRLMLGSVTERVLRNASCPVFAVRQTMSDSGTPDVTDHSVRIRRILCCVDFSAHSKRALEYALSLAKTYDADLTVFHALDGVAESADVSTETDTALENLQKLIPAAALSSTKTHLEVRLGKAYQEILKLASEDRADLIVVGVRGRHSLDLVVFGSTADRVIQLGPVPVLTVPI